MPEVKCPKCGAERIVDGTIIAFACNSMVTAAGIFCDSQTCRIRQLESTVATLRKALEYYRDKCRWCGGKGTVGPGFASDKPDDTFTMPCDACKIAATALEETK